MDIYVTKTFDKFISKHFSNYFIDLEKLSSEIKKAFSDNLYLKRPIMKFKIKINGVPYRLVGIVKENKIIPILIFLKKDKSFGENLIWNKELEILINHFASKITLDMQSNNYNLY